MMRALKIVLGFVLGLVALLLAAAVIVPLVVDPNDYKDRIVALVEEETGRRLTIAGDIDVSIFPWIGLELGEMALGNAPGFGPEPMARVVSADVKVEFMPLLEKRVVVDRVVVEGLSLDLGRDATGRGNWEGMSVEQGDGLPEDQGRPDDTTSSAADDESQDTSAPVLAGLTVGGVELSRADIRWRDLVAGVEYEATNLYFTTGPLAPGDPVSVSLKMDLNGRKPVSSSHLELTADTHLDVGHNKIQLEKVKLSLHAQAEGLPVESVDLDYAGQLDVDLVSRLFRFMGTELALKAKGPSLPSKGLELALKADIVADLSTEALSITGLDLQGPVETKLRGRLKGTDILSRPAITADLQLDRFNPRALLAYLEHAPPNTTDPKALTEALVSASFHVESDHLRFSDVNVTLDGAKMKASGQIHNYLQQPSGHFDFDADTLDVDRYLPPSKPKTKASKSSAKAIATPQDLDQLPGVAGKRKVPSKPSQVAMKGESKKIELPIALLRSLDLRGKVRVGRLKVAQGYCTDLSMSVVAKQGLLRLKPLKARLYQGNLRATALLDVRSNTPKMAVNQTLNGVHVEPLLQDFVGKAQLSGLANIDLKLNSRGDDVPALIANLNGKTRMVVNQGTVHGIDLRQRIRNTYLKLKNRPLEPINKGAEQTRFTKLSASSSIVDGVVSNRDLRVDSKALKASGSGRVDLPRERVDYLLHVDMVDALSDLGKSWKDFEGARIPVRVQGALRDPQYQVDMAKLITSLAKTEAKRKLEKKLIEKFGNDEKVQQKLRKLEEKLGGIKINIPGLQDALKGLF
ncbi:MAG: AsmA family protein [Magnetococcales bacterium]|nr:AsmA family protein [Magnetococcales bacterium]